ncbi:cache domain-containing protein [Pseudanabaena sp. FACHB-1998]|uniref:methyl-accepting chemotaxis protein n=1 Tax=Pseudanabaena sp. FACHB-1998 TaxID=2692858 RepID=UPI0016800156|nr:methyl-accepting chemotaxis protein [Pseudanabaena sp. FACHB-1998]MBD2177582.1 cache domain-containing protein [Pseudanabaena sp. FACHB-1998]
MLLKDKPEIPPSEDKSSTASLDASIAATIKVTHNSRIKPKAPFWKLPLSLWNNLGVGWKLSIVLLFTSGIPVLLVTQTLVKSSEESALKELKTSVKEKGSFFVSEYVMWTNSESRRDAEAIAKSIEGANLDLSDPNELTAKRTILPPLLQVSSEDIDPESIKNIKLITDNRGRSIEGNTLILKEDFTKFPLLEESDKLVPQSYKQDVVPSGSNLANLPIIKSAIESGKPMYGIELVKSADLQALGLDKQANIGIRPQITEGLPESKQPAPTGTYEIEQGKSGLVSMAVYPIKIKGKVVGTAVVGALLNRNYGIVDKFTKRYNMPTATIFAQDWRVATNIPYVNPSSKKSDKTRAIGTRSAREVSDAVLKEGQSYVGETNITGTNYLTFYAPLYDHRKLLNPSAKPVGIAYVGRPILEIQELLSSLSNAGYAIAIISIVVASAIGILVAASFARPLSRLSVFTQKIGQGETGERLMEDDRRDEIGVLSQELNKMAEQLEVLIAEKQMEAERIAIARQEVVQTEAELRIQEQRQAKESLQQRALELLIEVDPISRGDLTLRAKVTEDEIGTIADSYNSTIRNLRKLVLEVQKASQSFLHNVSQNEKTMQIVSGSASEQVAAIVQVLESIHELTESIAGVENRAIQAESQVLSTNQALIEGDAAMNSTVAGFNAIRETVSETAEKVQQLGEASQKISKVVKLISGFASQTNMLALNASIEAARAGEEGQGFGVVANEVRALAQRSAKATTEIRQLIEEIQAQTNELVKAMGVGTQQVNDGSHLVEETRQKLSDIATSSQQVNQLVREIAQAASAQSQTSEDVSQTIQNVAAIANSNSEYSKDMSEAFKELVQVAQELQVSVSQFKVN